MNTHLLNNWCVDASGLLYVIDDDPGKPEGSLDSIQRYDPSAQQWSTLAIPSRYGDLRAVTSAVPDGGDVLWFADVETASYRGAL